MERVSVSDAAKRLGVSASTVRRRLRSGELESEREAGANGRVWVLLGQPAEGKATPIETSPEPLQFVASASSVEQPAAMLPQTSWPTSASRRPISLDDERAARRGAATSLGFAWGARDRRTYRWLSAGTEAHPVFADLSRAARYHDRDQALAAIRIAQADAEPVQVFVEVGNRGVA